MTQRVPARPIGLFTLLACLLACLIGVPHPQAMADAPLALVSEGVSRHRIYIGPAAPRSVQRAADDLALCIRLATGATLPIDRGDAPPADAPFISLGDNAAAASAGLSSNGIAQEGYRIVARQGNLYILGQDTPDGGHTPQGGFSAGTRNGVYTFLENELDVRFLFPAQDGIDVPRRAAWQVSGELDLTEAPVFLSRRLPYIQNSHPAVARWSDWQKLGRSLRLEHGHSWTQVVPANLFDEHPDWFAMQGGRRVPPVGRYKLETTHPGLVAHFARAAVAAFDRQPALYSFSLSPSDSAGWSTSPQSLALTEKDPHGKESVTPLILDFYRNVALQARKQRPDRAVAGYIYAAYLYPPSKGIDPLPDNLHLVLAPHIAYGYTLFRDDIQKEWLDLLATWSAATPNLAYYDLYNWHSQDMGAPPAPGLAILAFTFPKLADRHITSMYLYGQDAWGTGALTNYVMAKLLWNPHADVQALADDFLTRAYGPSSAKPIGELYALLDRAMADHYRTHPEASYSLTPAILKSVYADHWPAIESLFLQAQAAATQPIHQKRLAMFEKNLLLLRWNLVRQKLLADTPSPLARTHAQIEALLSQPNDDLALSAQSTVRRDEARPVDQVRVQAVAAVTREAPSRYLLRGATRTLIYPLSDTDVTITPRQLTARGQTVRYLLINANGRVIQSGLLTQNEPIRFEGNENSPVFLDIAAGSASYMLEVRGAPWAVKVTSHGAHEDNGLHLLQHTTPLHFAVDDGAADFTLTLHSAAPGETAAIEVISPTGRSAGKLQTTDQSSQRLTIPTQGETGLWRINFLKPDKGLVDDVYIRFDRHVQPWVSLDGRQPLVVRPLR